MYHSVNVATSSARRCLVDGSQRLTSSIDTNLTLLPFECAAAMRLTTCSRTKWKLAGCSRQPLSNMQTFIAACFELPVAEPSLAYLCNVTRHQTF